MMSPYPLIQQTIPSLIFSIVEHFTPVKSFSTQSYESYFEIYTYLSRKAATQLIISVIFSLKGQVTFCFSAQEETVVE